MTKPLNNTSSEQARQQTSDLEIFGDVDAWQLICKASSESQGWMKTTKAMEIEGAGCLVQTETLQQEKARRPQYSISQSLIFIPNVKISQVCDQDGKLIGRKLESTLSTLRFEYSVKSEKDESPPPKPTPSSLRKSESGL